MQDGATLPENNVWRKLLFCLCLKNAAGLGSSGVSELRSQGKGVAFS